MRRFILFVLVLLAFSSDSPAQAPTALIRGRLTRGTFPAVYVQVTVYNQTMARSSPTVTAQDGMYYIRNVPFGDYYLEVWVNPQAQPLVYPIHVANPVTDIPPINLP